MQQYLIYFFVFMVVVLLTSVVGSRLATGVAVKGTVNRRMRMLSRSDDHYKSLVDLRLERGLRSDGSLALSFEGLRTLYLQSGVVIGWPKLLLYCAAFGALAGFIAARLSGVQFIGIALFVGTLIAGPYLFLVRQRGRRVAQFTKQLPDAIDVIVRSLQAGHPLTTSLALVASELPDPIGTEFGIMNDELTYGTDMERALTNLQQRAPAEDLSLFAMTILIQRQTGGNLAEILQTLSDTIRERQILKLKIRSLTAEGRFSSVLMTIFPLLIYLMIRGLVPDYFEPLFEAGIAGYVFGGCFVAILVGNAIMRKMVNFRV